MLEISASYITQGICSSGQKSGFQIQLDNNESAWSSRNREKSGNE